MQKLECGASVKVFKYIYPGTGLVGHYKNYKRPFFSDKHRYCKNITNIIIIIIITIRNKHISCL